MFCILVFICNMVVFILMLLFVIKLCFILLLLYNIYICLYYCYYSRRLARPSSARPAPPRVKRQDNVQDSLNER